MGRWVSTASARWYYDERSERLYEADIDRILMYHRVSGHASRSASRRFGNPSSAEEVPEGAKIATVERVRANVVVTGWADLVKSAVATNLSFCEFIETAVPERARWAIKDFSADAEGCAKVVDAIRHGKCIGVSDGSFKGQFGTACWVLTSQDEDDQTEGIRCPCVVPGGEHSHSAYRSELAGLYGMGTMVWALCEFYQIKAGAVELACDGLQALRHASSMEGITDARSPHFDLLTALGKCFDNALSLSLFVMLRTSGQ